MKSHIVFKFAAILLASLLLLTGLASAAGIVALASQDLYEQSVDDLYQQHTESTRRDFAVNLVHRYASLNLGNLPQEYMDNYYGSIDRLNPFLPGLYGYRIVDEKGAVVEEVTVSGEEPTFIHEIVVTDVTYRSLLSLTPVQYPEEPTSPPADSFDDPFSATEYTEEPASYHYIFTPGTDVYYSDEQQQEMALTYRYETLPPYTVTLTLLPGAVPAEPLWAILRAVYDLRDVLVYVVFGSLVLYAALLVYLCCAAGHKPGEADVRAGGLNRFPLDLYLAVNIGAIMFLVWFGAETVYYCLRHVPRLVLLSGITFGYACALLLTVSLFACAAQWKTPGGFWWRNSITGRCILLSGKLMLFLLGILKKLPAAFLRLLRGLKRLLVWMTRPLAKVYRLLPLTWQWLLTGGVLAILLFFGFRSYQREWLPVCIILYFAVIAYGATAFGILLESTKRMRSGDLETKVSDQFLLGSFREFSGELNALADVAVVAAQKQLKSERMKTELITNVSHDIKTPLTSIINYVDLLHKPHTEQEQQQYLEVLNRQSHRLKKLVDDLMEMSKATTGNLTVEITRLNAAEAVNQALGEFADKLEKAGLEPVFRQPETSIHLMADGRLLWRVLSNLLSNTVKYALPGTRVYIDLAEMDGKTVISMKNISREPLNIQAEELLERFVRGDAARNTEGSGLGLNIAKSLMELQKGQLQLLVDGDLFKVTLIFPSE